MTQGDTGAESDSTDASSLSFPDETWSGFLRNHFGPSVLWALLSIGSSHVILAPTVGARYGIFGVWLFVLVYSVKWGGWELGIRYNYGKGKNPVEGYEKLPGPDRWGQWFTFAVYLLLWTNIHGAITAGTAAFVGALFSEAFGISMGIVEWYVVLTLPIAALVFYSKYEWLENLLKTFVVFLGLIVVLTVLVAPPDAETVTETAFAVPDLTSPVFIALFAGVAAYTPIGLSSSVSIGSWSMAKNEGAGELDDRGLDSENPEYHGYIRSWTRTGLRDFNIAYALSLVISVSMVVLATSTLYGTGNVPSGDGVPIAVGQILGETYGRWAFYAMLVGATVALLSTVIGNLDAVSRVLSDVLETVNVAEDTERWRRGFVVLVAGFSVVPVLAIGNFPVVLITFSAALVGVFQVFFYVANYYIVKTELPEEFHPSKARTAYYVVGMVLVALFGVVGALNNFGLVGAGGGGV